MNRKALKAALIVVAMIACRNVTSAQDSTPSVPTVDQCKADETAWMAKLEADHGTDDVTAGTLTDWETEMTQCRTVDPANDQDYSNASNESVDQIGVRLLDFLDRHALTQLFYEEDKAGKR
jgi:hypothetical protein